MMIKGFNETLQFGSWITGINAFDHTCILIVYCFYIMFY